ncbi:unnamed protein product [Merluccius merluccius]
MRKSKMAVFDRGERSRYVSSTQRCQICVCVEINDGHWSLLHQDQLLVQLKPVCTWALRASAHLSIKETSSGMSVSSEYILDVPTQETRSSAMELTYELLKVSSMPATHKTLLHQRELLDEHRHTLERLKELLRQQEQQPTLDRYNRSSSGQMQRVHNNEEEADDEVSCFLYPEKMLRCTMPRQYLPTGSQLSASIM